MPDTNEAAPSPAAQSTAAARSPYRVLARKHRPASFADLIGQDTLVRTLTNAIEKDRVPQAFVLTGVRGVGKTTTARIIARALNCVGTDGAGGPTSTPCGTCEHCVSIAEDRHVDVIEMDAASRTGVDDIRELIDGVRYRPVSARRKVYIVDEVHMLSRQAFNALLKTLEEPPEAVVFVFATTEIRKVPVTVLSRCMRFDLRRVEQDVLVAHFRKILESEGVRADDEALAMIARAADGSVRDGLSLLDQAIALSGGGVEETQVKAMLGLADRGRIYDLYDSVLSGRAAEALDILGDLYNAGADPVVVLQDMLEVTHTLTRIQVIGDSGTMAGVPESDRARDMARALKPAQLARNWQMLLKGLQETQTAPQPRQAAEMVLLRLIYAAELPTPGELVRKLREDGRTGGNGSVGDSSPPPSPGGGASTAGADNAGTGARAEGSGDSPRALTAGQPDARAVAMSAGQPDARSRIEAEHVPADQSAGSADAMATPERESVPCAESTPTASEAPPTPPTLTPAPRGLRDLVALCQERREPRLAADLRQSVRLVRFEEGLIELNPLPHAPQNFAGRLSRCLGKWTGRRWVVTLTSDVPGEPTLAEQDRKADAAERQRLLSDPRVMAVLETFPGAKLVTYRGGAVADEAASDDFMDVGPDSEDAFAEDGLDGIDDFQGDERT